MKVLVTGVGGQLGHDVMNELHKRGIIGIGSDIHNTYYGIDDNTAVTNMQYVQMDITDEKTVEQVICMINPDAVIHCAAWTAVDAAEDEQNKEKVWTINVNGTKNIVKACKKVNAKMMYISTDYVFNGQGDSPWEPDCKDYAPLNYYGKSKLAGELEVSKQLTDFFIVRTAWVFGLNGNNFIKTMLKLAEKYDTIRVVNDQVGTPTYTTDLARLLVDMIVTDKYGYYHATNEGGYISWYEFACEIFKQSHLKVAVIPVSSSEYGLSKAKRPFNSRLNKEKLIANGFNVLPTWNNALKRYLCTLKDNEKHE